MMEFYAAYWNYRDPMDSTEALIRDAAMKAAGSLQLSYQAAVDLAAPRATGPSGEVIVKHTEAGDNVDSRDWLIAALRRLGFR